MVFKGLTSCLSLWFWGKFPASALKRDSHRLGVNSSVHLLKFWFQQMQEVFTPWQLCTAVMARKNRVTFFFAEWALCISLCRRQYDRIWYIFYQIRLNALRQPPCLILLQRLEQDGAVRPDLRSFGNKWCIYGHTGRRLNRQRWC